ncbi:MAPEG family protein [Crocosphaera sp. XPORK-15E]|uniref:MAPEG family protein n=1 Tax=Crocosphaera sp. XPORK-15E TaxID=3110247 RepID=UPI002B1F3B76|nr:MAPEG family protein [Crocosphaera sp. XPORK-15E]MEA5535472.1 MAPEG family protein [Crocosphaera sp. XPORK-15E]
MEIYPSLVTVSALAVYLIITLNVGRTRAKYNVKPPAMTGDPNFERALRVQQNTLEQMVLFLPLLWIFCYYINPVWGSGIGAFWIIGRILYAWGYYQAAEKRILGFAIGSLSSVVLLIGSLVGMILVLVKSFSA